MTLTLPYQPTFIVADGTTRSFNYLFDAVSVDFIGVAIKRTDGSVYTPIFSKDLDQTAITLSDSEPTPELGALVCIYRNTPEIQDVAFRTLDGYNARAMENILSKIVAMIQETRDVAEHTTVRTTFPQRDISIQVIADEDDTATVVIDAQNKQLKRGLYFKIAGGNLLASQDGKTFIQMPKSSNILEMRQVIEENPYRVIFQYRVGETWYSMDLGAVEKTANEAKEKSEQAIKIANDAKSEIDSAVETVNSLETQTTKNTQDIAENRVAIGVNEAAIAANEVAITETRATAREAKTAADIAVTKTGDMQTQIDAMAAASDVADVVGTYADLQAYDTSKLTDNAIIKVLNDETQGGASTYYRWTIGA